MSKKKTPAWYGLPATRACSQGASSRPYHLELSSMVLRSIIDRAFSQVEGRAGLLEGPRMVDTHSYILSPLGPAEQFAGGSSEISASSFWMRFAADDTPAPLAFEAISAGVSVQEGSNLQISR